MLRITSGPFETVALDPTLLPTNEYILESEQLSRKYDETMKAVQPMDQWPQLPLQCYLMHYRINAARYTPLDASWMKDKNKQIPKHFPSELVAHYFNPEPDAYPLWSDVPQWLCLQYIKVATYLRGDVPLLVDSPHGRGVVGAVWSNRMDIIYPSDPKRLAIIEGDVLAQISWVTDEMLVRSPFEKGHVE
ncbi:hypothetical protein ccbrp13_34410 [Ktedonobacteria bacterium brp13]|nr:hypothetical protein ccbrp13_34410 [Ktedonobacteria bacterium brp13]